jgi:hypothetical protein
MTRHEGRGKYAAEEKKCNRAAVGRMQWTNCCRVSPRVMSHVWLYPVQSMLLRKVQWLYPDDALKTQTSQTPKIQSWAPIKKKTNLAAVQIS